MQISIRERLKRWAAKALVNTSIWIGLCFVFLWAGGMLIEFTKGGITFRREAGEGLYGMMALLLLNMAWQVFLLHFGAGEVTPKVLAVIALPMAACAAISAALLYLTGKAWTDANYTTPLVTFAIATIGWLFARHSSWSTLKRRKDIPTPEPTPEPTRAAVACDPNEPADPPREPSPARESRPTISFTDIYGNDAIKTRLAAASRAILDTTGGNAPRNGILLFGKPGNGKTSIAQALAGELKLPLLTISVADIKSKWIGVGVERLRATFDHAIEIQPCVLFIDEIDSLLQSREDRLHTIKDDQDMANALLTLLVDIRSSRVIVVAATNHLDQLDSAGIREGRFDFKVEITPPDEPARIGLLAHGVRTHVPTARVSKELIGRVAQRWNGFSVKRILAVTEELPAYLERQGSCAPTSLGFEHFMGALRAVQGRAGTRLENVKPLDELILDTHAREMLDLIVARMKDPEYTEERGGTLPTGILFQGPPGTGKTTACKALAHAIHWAFLPATGTQLARDEDALRKLYDQATELRPAIIFIDEADELLARRTHSVASGATNLLLTLMDGVGDRVRDVVWVAATNHPENIDPALLRGGRFTEKVQFELPAHSQVAAHLQRWLEQRKVRLQDDIPPGDVVALLGDACSIADAEAVIQQALNRALSRRANPVIIERSDIMFATRAVLSV